MIPALSLMIGFYIFVRFCEIYAGTTEKPIKLLCALGLLVVIACVGDIIVAGGSLARQIQPLERLIP